MRNEVKKRKKTWNEKLRKRRTITKCKYRYNESHPGQAIYHECNYKCNSVIRPGGTSFFNWPLQFCISNCAHLNRDSF